MGYNKPTANTVANGWRSTSAELYWLRVPYWSLVLPLTMLAAWLILVNTCSMWLSSASSKHGISESP